MKKTLALIISLLIIMIKAEAQNLIIFEQNTAPKYVLKYQNSSDASQNILNFLIKDYARYQGKSFYYVQFKFGINQKLMISRDQQALEIRVGFMNPKIDKVFYKGFNIGEVLLPATISFDCELKKPNGKILKTFSEHAQILKSDGSSFQYKFIDSNRSNKYVLNLKNIRYNYASQNREKYKRRLNLIDDYYQISEQLKDALADVTRIDERNVDYIHDYQAVLDDVGQFLDRINSRKIQEKLNLQQFDPVSFLPRLRQLRLRYSEKTDAINYTLSILHEIYYNRGLEAMVNNEPEIAYGLFIRSLEINPIFAPSLLQLARIDYNNGNLDKANEKIRDLLTKLRPDMTTHLQGLKLAEDIYNSYLDLASKLNKEASYKEALLELNNAELLCRKIRDFKCSDALFYIRKEAKSGIYYELTDQAEKLLDQGNLTEAEKAINVALSYQNDNKAELGDLLDALSVFQQIKKTYYLQYLGQAKKLLDTEQYGKAYAQLREAENLQQKYQFDETADFLPMMQSALLPLLKTEIERGEAYAAKNDLKKAREVLLSVKTKMLRYNLVSSPELSPLLSKLQKAIFQQECINAQADYDKLFAAAKTENQSLHYIKSAELLDRAVQLADKMADCMIDAEEAKDLQVQILPAVVYQKLQNEIENYVLSRQYAMVVQRYADLDRQYYSENVSSLGITHVSLYDYIKSKSNAFIAYGVQYYTLQKEFDKALNLLNILFENQYKPTNIKKQQKLIGTQLALRDYKNVPNDDPKLKVLDYTMDMRWYRYLKKAYLKQWRKLN